MEGFTPDTCAAGSELMFSVVKCDSQSFRSCLLAVWSLRGEARGKKASQIEGLVTLHLKTFHSRWEVSGAAEQKMIEGVLGMMNL